MLSVIIPTDRETHCPILQKTLLSLSQIQGIEVICVDKAEAHSRAERLNIGFHRSQGNLILFHHPRSFVDPEGIRKLVRMSGDPAKVWGGFMHRFDMDHPLLKFTSWYSNAIRGQRYGVLYLDHCIFFDRQLWIADLPLVDIFEDTVLSYQFRKNRKPLLLPFSSTTSAIRFQKNGVYKQSLLNQILKIGFHLNVSDKLMNRIYEKGLGLNSRYSKGKK